MHYSIVQVGPMKWELRAADGTVVGTFEDGIGRTGYDVACIALSGVIGAEMAASDNAAAGDGLLPETWTDDGGIAFSVALPGGRDFSECTWSWRDPAACLVPLMFQTSTEYGHMGADLAGFCEEINEASGTVHGGGRFYDNEAGVAFRDLLLGGRKFGVSVDPSEAVDVDETFECTEWDDEGFCEGGDWKLVFKAYEIAGLTGTPFPGFEKAAIKLGGKQAAAATAPVRASLSIPVAPPVEWLTLGEPHKGQRFIDGRDGGDVLVEQMNDEGAVVGYAVPLEMRDDGLVYGHLTMWGQCHVADPWGPGVCASAQPSRNGYADFLTGHVVCSDGTDVPTGELVVGCEHSSAFDVRGVRDHLAHAGMGWASVNVVDGQYGPWLCGVLRPDLSEAQVRVLRALSLSGEWVGELAGILAVNAPGLPVQRALAASAFNVSGVPAPFTIPMPVMRASARKGELAKLVGGTIVRRCAECEKRRALGLDGTDADSSRLLRHIARRLDTVERRTRHLIGPEAEATRSRLEAVVSS